MGLVYRVVFSDEPTPALVHGAYLALLVDGKIVPLPHPAEEKAMREHGESVTSASLKGRYLQVTERLCMQCGKLLQVPQIAFGAPGCLPSLLAGGGSGAYLLLWAQWPLFESAEAAATVLCTALLFTWLAGFVYSRVGWRARQRSIAVDACPGCGCKVLRSIPSLAGQTVELEGRGRSVTVEAVKKS